MDEENDSDYLDEDGEHREHLTHKSHIEEDSEYVEREQGNDGSLDGLYDDLLEVVNRIFQGGSVKSRQTETEGESEDKGCHHVHHRRDGHGEIRRQFDCRRYSFNATSGIDHSREKSSSCEV